MGSESDRWRLKQEKYPSYSFSLNRETQFLQEWVDRHKATKQLPAVVRMGLLTVRMLEELGCRIPEDDPEKLRVFLDLLVKGNLSPTQLGAARPDKPVLNAGEVREEKEPGDNMDEFLKGL